MFPIPFTAPRAKVRGVATPGTRRSRCDSREERDATHEISPALVSRHNLRMGLRRIGCHHGLSIIRDFSCAYSETREISAGPGNAEGILSCVIILRPPARR